MTFNELLTYMGAHCKHDIMDGDAAATLAKAQAGSHKNELAGHIIRELYAKTGVASPETELDRVTAINSMGPMRLFYMRDDAPVEGFRLVEDMVREIDGAYNEEALNLKEQG